MGRMRAMPSHRLVVLVTVGALTAVACSSGGGDAEATASTGATGWTAATGATAAAPTSPTGASGVPSSACQLFTQADAEELFGEPVEQVADAVELGLITASAIPAGTGVCYYRPTPDDGSRFAAVAVLPPGALTEEEYRAQVEGGVGLGGPGDDGFEVNGGIITRVGDTVVLAVATTAPGKANDPSAGLEIATLVVSRLPPPEPDPDNPACGLLTEELAESVLGIDLAFDSDLIVDDQRSGCVFHDDGTGGPTSVYLSLTRGPDAASDYRAAHEGSEDGAEFQEIDGLGDEAFATAYDVFVLAGDSLLRITVQAGAEFDVEGAIELGRAIVERL
jgi:hypothetical protein